jgi:hypothetical protein
MVYNGSNSGILGKTFLSHPPWSENSCAKSTLGAKFGVERGGGEREVEFNPIGLKKGVISPTGGGDMKHCIPRKEMRKMIMNHSMEET